MALIESYALRLARALVYILERDHHHHEKELLIMKISVNDQITPANLVPDGEPVTLVLTTNRGSLPADIVVALSDTTDFALTNPAADTWEINRTGTVNAAPDGTGSVDFVVSAASDPDFTASVTLPFAAAEAVATLTVTVGPPAQQGGSV